MYSKYGRGGLTMLLGMVGVVGVACARPDDGARAEPGQPAAEPSSTPPARSPAKERWPGRSLYLSHATREAEARSLPPALADAVMRIESSYNPAAFGGVGEVGLMQIRPSTAAMLGFRGTDADLAVPETNIRYGVMYLAEAWRLAGGDLCRALMKYRAGHGEERMTPLSVEYCRRARAHLAEQGWPGEDVLREVAVAARRVAPPVLRAPAAEDERGVRTPQVASADSRRDPTSTPSFWTRNREKIAEAFLRVSVRQRSAAFWSEHRGRMSALRAQLGSSRVVVR